MTPKPHVLPDLLAPDLKLVFVGTAASAASAKAGAYYAHPGNLFWPTLFKTGLTPGRFAPTEFAQLLALGIGLTDIAKTATGSDAEIPDDSWDASAVLDKIARFRPRYVGFASKTAATSFLGIKKVNYGLVPVQALPEISRQGLGDTSLFVLPSPSGRARGYWDESYWLALAQLVMKFND